MDIKQQIQDSINASLQTTDLRDVKVVVSQSNDSRHGEYTTNVAMMLAKQLGKSPMEIAEELKANIASQKESFIEKVEVIKPGFINFFLTKATLVNEVKEILEDKKIKPSGKKIMVEFTDPNPFKEFHIGHLFSNIVGESISRLLESQGNEVRRVCYQGDVGMHVAKALFGLKRQLNELHLTIDQLEAKDLTERIKILGAGYAIGAAAYEDEPTTKEEMLAINKHVYEQDDTEINTLYQKGRAWSLSYFEEIYKRLGTKFTGYYFESKAGPIGVAFVKDHMNIFKQSEGAIIFPGEEYGLHTRVFINSQGLPTYEAKELGLAPTKYADYRYDQSIIITGNEVNEYFRTVLKALSLIKPELVAKTKHFSHGMLRLISGKISSRKGNVPTAEGLLNQAVEEVQKISEMDHVLADQVGIGAVKYALLKNSIGKDISFNFDDAVSLEGDSGPYLQYTFVRTQSILNKFRQQNSDRNIETIGRDLNFETYTFSQEESELLRTISFFRETISEAAEQFAPHIICTYLFSLAQQFNLFYQKDQILKAEKQQQEMRLFLVQATAKVLQNGLQLLGIAAPEKM